MKLLIAILLFAVCTLAISRPLDIPDEVSDFCQTNGCVLMPADVAQDLINKLEMCGMGLKGTSWTSKSF